MKKESSAGRDIGVQMKAISCYLPGCIPPPEPMSLRYKPPTNQLWSDSATWENFTYDGFPPIDGDNLTIPIGKTSKYLFMNKLDLSVNILS